MDILEELKSIEGDAVRRAEKEIAELRSNVETSAVSAQKIILKLSTELNALRKKADTEVIFEGAEIAGKQFPFIRVSITGCETIVKKYHPELVEATRAYLYNWAKQKKRIAYLKENPTALYKDLVRENLIYFSIKTNRRQWKHVRSIAFEKGFSWKWFHIIPKELRCKYINPVYAIELKKNFEKYFTEKASASSASSVSVDNSETRNEATK
jgi:hypothetical protein